MNPVKKLRSWWQGPTDAETLASEAEGQRQRASSQTIRISQNTAPRGSSLLSAPTPEVLDPSRDRHDRR